MQKWHEDVNTAFKYFSEVQLPELDDVVHKHIDILRVSEQDHYNKLSSLLQNAVQNRYEISEDLEELKKKIVSIQSASDDIAQSITQKTVEKLTGVTKAFESELLLLKSHTEALKTSLNEGESRLSNIRMHSEMIMKQMVLSSQKMDELSEKNSQAYTLLQHIDTLTQEIQTIESDYTKAQKQLSLLVSNLEQTKMQEIENMKKSIEQLSKELSTRVDESLEKLHQHYHITSDDISESVKVLAKKAQLHKGYGENEL
jgi:chromosome segregation ATPase